MKYLAKQVNGTEWAVVMKNAAGEFALQSVVGSSHVAELIAQNMNSDLKRGGNSLELREEIRFHALPRVVSRISKRGNKVWEVAA